MVSTKQLLDLLEGLVVDVDAMGGIRVSARGNAVGLAEDIDTRRWANLAIHVKAASELLVASGYPQMLAEVEDSYLT